MAASIRQLDELFLLVVVGEFNAGKSAFINALVGQPVLHEGVTPTTARIHLLEYGDTLERHGSDDGVQVVRAPIDVLRDVHIVDTPGTNAIIREHERLTNEFVPRSDLVLFVTSADRPFTETERSFLETIRDWGKKIVIVINKVDIFDRQAEVDEVVGVRPRQRAAAAGHRPRRVSGERAPRAARQGGRDSLWAASRFEALERYLRETLDHESRFRLKLANPLGVGHALAGRYATIAAERLALLSDDLSLLEEIDRQLPRLPRRSRPRLRAADGRRREGAHRDGAARAPVLRRHDAHRPGHGSAESGAHAEGVHGAGRRRRAARDRAARRRS